MSRNCCFGAVSSGQIGPQKKIPWTKFTQEMTRFPSDEKMSINEGRFNRYEVFVNSKADAKKGSAPVRVLLGREGAPQW